VLLDGAESFGRGCVAGEDDEGTPTVEEVTDSLEGKLIDNLEGPRAVGRTSIIAQVEVVVLGHELADFPQNGEAAITAVEDTNGSDGRNYVFRVWL
jgi:hypothetical protein